MARAKHPLKKLPTTLDELKDYILLGKRKRDREQRVKRSKQIKKKLTKLSDKIVTLKKKGKQPKGVIVYAAGPDSVGKTSTGYLVMDALK